MMKFVSCLFLIVYIVTMGFADPTKANSPSVKVKIVHTHDVISGHKHHHDFDNENVLHYEGEDDHEHGRDEPTESTSHSHERLVSMAAGYVLAEPDLFPIVTMALLDVAPFAICNESRPKDRALQSIFRPPIFA